LDFFNLPFPDEKQNTQSPPAKKNLADMKLLFYWCKTNIILHSEVRSELSAEGGLSLDISIREMSKKNYP
jgi:hypothetical protein